MKKLIIYLLVMIGLVLISSCKEDESPTESASGIKEITIQHFGVDWSEGLTGEQILDYNNIDGETIAWCPTGNGGGWMQGIWYRSRFERTYKVNTNDLVGLNSIDTNLWASDLCSTPLTPNSVWAAKANDGFVVFKVLEVATDSASISNDQLWSAKVQYKFSTSTSF